MIQPPPCVRFAHDYPAYFELIFAAEVVACRSDALEAEGERTKETLRGFLRQWQAAGVIADGDLDQHLHLFWSTAHGIATLLKGALALDVKTREDRRRLTQAAAQMLLIGLSTKQHVNVK